MHRIDIQKGVSVRNFFRDDLRLIADHGICLLPEWICHAMTQSVLEASWEPRFYEVTEITKARIPFELSFQDLMAKLKQSLNFGNWVAVLLAHPLGYIDPNVVQLLSLCRANLKSQSICLFLDLSQSYGRFDFIKEIKLVDATYISFNGNKLINTGGAIRLNINNFLTHTNESEKIFRTYQNLQILFQQAYKEQHKQAILTFETLLIQSKNADIIGQILYSKNHIFNESYTRSNFYRTALKLSFNDNKAVWDELIQLGFGQTAHSDPQLSFAPTSTNYRSWLKNSFFLFCEQRNR